MFQYEFPGAITAHAYNMLVRLYDNNGDGRWGLDELVGGHTQEMRRRLDHNEDGYIDLVSLGMDHYLSRTARGADPVQ